MIKEIILFIFFAILVFNSTDLKAQIQGISAKKIKAINHQGLKKKSGEFEPSIQYNFTRYKWDQNGDKQNLYSSNDSLLVEQDIYLRMAYAFSDKFEIGAYWTKENSNWSFRQRLYNKEKWGLAFLGSFNVPFGNEVVDKNFKTRNNTMNYLAGLAGSYQFFAVSSIDINFQYQGYFGSGAFIPSSEYYILADYGHYIHTSRIQLLVGSSFQNTHFENHSESKWTYYQGVSIETNPNYMIFAYFNYDLLGRNTNKSLGFNVAWTLIL